MADGTHTIIGGTPEERVHASVRSVVDQRVQILKSDADELAIEMADRLDASGTRESGVVLQQYAKRQRSWFRGVEAVWRGHPEDLALAEAVVDALNDPGP